MGIHKYSSGIHMTMINLLLYASILVFACSEQDWKLKSKYWQQLFDAVDSKIEVTSTPVELPTTSISLENHSSSVVENRGSKLFAKFFNTFQSSEQKQRSLPDENKMDHSNRVICKLRGIPCVPKFPIKARKKWDWS